MNGLLSVPAAAAWALAFSLSSLGPLQLPSRPHSPGQNPQSHISMFSENIPTGQAQLHSDYFPIPCSCSSAPLIFQPTLNRTKEITTCWGLGSDPSQWPPVDQPETHTNVHTPCTKPKPCQSAASKDRSGFSREEGLFRLFLDADNRLNTGIFIMLLLTQDRPVGDKTDLEPTRLQESL